MVYIFGYGSLIDADCRQCTFPAQHAYAARLKGFQRYWSGLKSGDDRSAVVIAPDEKASVNGVLIPFDEAFLPELDERERDYQRICIQLPQIEVLSELPEQAAKIYTYVANDYWHPQATSPILQSYLDVCLRGCLAISEQYAREFLLSTNYWVHHWVDDRHQPLYPRAANIDGLALQQIDSILTEMEHLSAYHPLNNKQ
ncbi:gamma-glutamylcyclotransferase family protein [Agarivorans sp. MS3-6]|uniref:gamma-glutamylcyclotransferase family protein n=1 Tax=Agarivorans sp. TSD2052 TaxID=2937286 RepID=UPI00200E9128|nr:gamma-glutamylcyclotransferase family protein [Agarivorans sp. TSD2052]UPW19418.1 gamma-glutamylcyclotransferase [Agarivorans sp. TSD2052]